MPGKRKHNNNEPMDTDEEVVFSIGHSTTEIDEFIDQLKRNGVEVLVDIRTIPGSRKNPQFGQNNLAASIADAGLEYIHMPGLGGRRHSQKDSVNVGWRNDSFRAYADYMMTPQFHTALKELIELAAKRRVAIMCAEAVPWRCHRNLVSDSLYLAGVTVKHIIGNQPPHNHKLCAFAHPQGANILYA